jgi:hypothetical protein
MPSLHGVPGPGGSPEQQLEYEVGYIVKDPSSNGHSSHGHGHSSHGHGHSSHGHGTINTRNSSHTHVASTRNPSPTLSRPIPGRARFSLNPERGTLPSAWPPSRSEAPTRRASIDNGSASYYPHRVNSDPVVFHDAPHLMPYVYSRRESSEVAGHELFPPPVFVYTAPPEPPSSLLRPPSATQIPTLQTLQRLGLPHVNEHEQSHSPATSNASIHRVGLLGTPPHHPAGSVSSFRDHLDYSRQLTAGVSVSQFSISNLV